ncbi:MAG: hypothetical protein NTX49_02210 [Chlamydiae bacterium]|nr:hypothetical protein [Chlamydiota bacterium]
MTRYLIALICYLLTTTCVFSEDVPKNDLVPSTPDQISTLISEPGYLIGGLISPLSGQPVLRQTDLIVKGAQNIILTRTYVPPYMPCSFPQHKGYQEEHDKRYLYRHVRYNYKGWQFYPHVRLELYPRTMEVRLSEPSGMTLDFRLSGPNYSVTTLASPPYAINNTAGDRPSGRYDPRNIRISFEEKGNKIVVHATEGSVRTYYKAKWATINSYVYLLEKEILPSGKVLKYHYNEYTQLTSIESLDPKERHIYASLHITGTPWHNQCHFTSSSGQVADYFYKQRPVQWKIKEKINGQKVTDIVNTNCPPILTSVSSPFYRHESLNYCGRFLLSSYSGKKDTFSINNAGFGEGSQHYKTHKLLLPVGQSDAMTEVYELSYQPPVAGQKEGTTTVKNSDGTSLIYHFSKNLLTTAIQYFDQNGALKKEKIFSWDEKNWLQSLELRDGSKNTLYRKSFVYDRFGNPILEIFTGDLIGDGSQETFTIKRTFSEDGRNLLLKEESEDGKVVCFTYLGSTDLVTSKLTKEGDKILLREFFVYDDCYNLLQEISDDGLSEDKDDLTNISQWTATTYRLRQSAPFLHMPEWVEETCWEGGCEKSLKKSHLIYDQYGNIAQEEVYDAVGRHAYTICKTYNERGDVLTETSRLGQQAVYTYDAKGHRQTSTNFSHRINTTFRPDTKGRLRERIEKGEGGVIHSYSSDYDFHDRLIHKRDSFSNSTRYTYDPLVSEVTETNFPFIASVNGDVTSVKTASTYDAFGRELTKTDPNGNVTTYRYNAYGSQSEILHPNGGIELFRYAKNGRLLSHTDLDGLTIQYTHDVLGRVLSKTYISATGSILAEETFTYNAFNLLTKTDKEGNTTQYTYDGAGRKIREEFCGKSSDFSYDSLGWLASICKYNGSNPLFIHYKRDLEGRILEELKTDASGSTLYKISYSYDSDGNQETITRYINGKKAVDTYSYDAFGRLTQHRDAEGYISETTYDETFTNTLGQRVLQTRVTDPRGIATITTQDALARPIRVEILNTYGATISCREMIYDPQGNLSYRKDYVYEQDRFQNSQTFKYTYTSDHQIESLTRGLGTKDARITTYTYLPSGKIASKTLASGITLAYSYHPLGFLSHLDSSDGKIHHAFEYDRLGYLTYTVDENQKIVIKREIDPFGNVTQEVFPSGLEVKKDYDDFNRLIYLKMANQGEVLYTHDPLFLRGVTRTSDKGETLYTHTYEGYDLDGHLLSECLMGNLGQVVHLTDLRGQKASISSPYFSQEWRYDSAQNLISNITDGVEERYSYDGLSQLCSEKSKDLSFVYAYDSLHNKTLKNGNSYEINGLNELVSAENTRCSYDLNGNQVLKQSPSETSRFIYDPLNRLIEVSSDQQKVTFSYDPLGRRLSKTVYAQADYGWKVTACENYLYHGQNEIGAFSSHNEPINLRVLGLSKHKNNPTTVGLEIEGQVFAPLLDVQGNIRRLIDLDTRSAAISYDFTAFGEELQSSKESPLNPWRFASKRFDPELGLIDFGKRYYDPKLARWLTTDPAGFIDGVNLYQYVFNNPFRYRDPDGQFVVALPLLALTWKIVAVAAAAAIVSYELEHQHSHSNSALARSFNSAVHQMVQHAGGAAQYTLHKLDTGKKKVREEPNDLEEHLALEEAKAKPQDAEDEIMQGKIKDPRYPEKEWKKVDHTHTRSDGTEIDIHYWEHRLTGEKSEFKFKND